MPNQSPHMTSIKNKSGKAANLHPLYSPDSKPRMDPFNNNVNRGYNMYVGHLENGEMKNNSNHIKHIFSQAGQDKSFELPHISQNKRNHHDSGVVLN